VKPGNEEYVHEQGTLTKMWSYHLTHGSEQYQCTV